MISKWDNNATDYFNRKNNRTNNNNHTSSPIITQQQQENIDNNNSPVFYADPNVTNITFLKCWHLCVKIQYDAATIVLLQIMLKNYFKNTGKLLAIKV